MSILVPNQPDDHDRPSLTKAEPFMRRHVEIFRDFTRATGHQHPNAQTAIRNYHALLQAMNLPAPEIANRLRDLTP